MGRACGEREGRSIQAAIACHGSIMGAASPEALVRYQHVFISSVHTSWDNSPYYKLHMFKSQYETGSYVATVKVAICA